MTDLVSAVLSGGIALAAPLLLAALGETIGERAGILNLGVEGEMLFAALVAFYAAYTSGNLWLGLLAGVLAGALLGLIMAIVSVTLAADQIVTGVAITLFGMGLSIFLNKVIFGMSAPSVVGFQPIEIPLLSALPVIGPILFRFNVLVYLGLVLVPVFSIVLFGTTFGLKIQAVGENPAAADAAGVNVFAARYLCVTFAGAMAGLAGAFLSLGYLSMFTETMTAGRGFIAVIIVILGAWSPYRVLGGAMLFGVIESLQLNLQHLATAIPYQALNMLPYITALIVLVVIHGRHRAPAALCIPYKRR